MEYVWAFLVGGALCAIGQALIDYTKLTPARILVSFVVAGVILSGVGLYRSIRRYKHSQPRACPLPKREI